MLGKYDKIWENITNSIIKGFDGEPVYNKEYLKTKIILYEGKVNTVLKLGWNCCWQ